MSKEPLLEVKGLKTYFYTKDSTIRAVDGVDLKIHPKEVVCIVGESGSGKSVTSLSVMGLISKTNGKIVDGEIIFDGKDLLEKSEAEMSELRGNEISMIFQEPMTALNPVLRIGDQMTEGYIRHYDVSKEEANQKAIEMLEFVSVPRAKEIMDEYPHQLSGGLRQRVMIAMMMMCDPKLLIADEPTTALDVTIQAQVLELMKEMSGDLNTAILLVTHDLGVVADMADHVVVMYAGQVVETTDADTLFEEALHPYTKGLMESIPSISEDKDRLYSIPGTVPHPANFPKGCRFANRCPIAEEQCFQKMPNLREIRPGHSVRCDLI